MNLAILAEIANAFSVLATNPLFGSKSDEVAGIAGLVALAFNVTGMNDVDRQALLAQIKQANAEGRGLTDDEMAAWKARHEAAKAIIEGWKPAAD